jgi:hypothetical protein
MHLMNVPLRLPVSSTLPRRIQTDLARSAVCPEVLAAILRRAALCQPVTCGEGLVLANSMIEGTEAQVRLMY